MHPSKEAHTTFPSDPNEYPNSDDKFYLCLKGHQFKVLWEVYAESVPNA